jgi:hypothetical protein
MAQCSGSERRLLFLLAVDPLWNFLSIQTNLATTSTRKFGMRARGIKGLSTMIKRLYRYSKETDNADPKCGTAGFQDFKL